jgi:hypothetical protein
LFKNGLVAEYAPDQDGWRTWDATGVGFGSDEHAITVLIGSEAFHYVHPTTLPAFIRYQLPTKLYIHIAL